MANESPNPELPLALPRDRRMLAGVSGGVDSVALLHALHAQGFRRVVVAHLNHGLRGKAAAADAAFVRRLAARMGLRVIEARVDTAALAASQKMSLETAARQARYAFFAAAARQARCRTVVLAHHADDQAETFLFNLLRGSGPAGLGGMRARAVRDIGSIRLEILRPLLGVRRSEIEAYARRHRLRHREDASNLSQEHMRNRLRQTVIPFLSKEFGRDIRTSLWRAAEIISAQQEWLAQQLPADAEELPVPTLRALPEALQREIIYRWLRNRAAPGVSFELVEKIRALIPPGAAQAKINLPGARHVRRRSGRIFITPGDIA